MPAYRASRCDLKTCTFFRAMTDRRTRRISSSLLPLNITPLMTSIHPPVDGKGMSEIMRPCEGNDRVEDVETGPVGFDRAVRCRAPGARRDHGHDHDHA